MKEKLFLKETDLGKWWVDHLRSQGYETWHEVHTRVSDIDVVAKKDGHIYTYQLKLTYSDAVLMQALTVKQSYDGYHSVVYAGRVTSEVKNFFAEMKGIGVYSVSDRHFVTAKQHVKPMYTTGRKDLTKHLFDDQKESEAGSVAGGSITPFKRSCAYLAEVVKDMPDASIHTKKLYEEHKDKLHWRSKESFRSCLIKLEGLKEIDLIRRVVINI